MASQQEKAFCVLRFEVFRSLITVQGEFRARFRKDAPARCTKLTLHCNHRSEYLKTEHTESLFLLRRHLGNWPRIKREKRTAGSAWETWTVAAADCVHCARVRWVINFLLTFETAPFFCVYPVYQRWCINEPWICNVVGVSVTDRTFSTLEKDPSQATLPTKVPVVLPRIKSDSLWRMAETYHLIQGRPWDA